MSWFGLTELTPMQLNLNENFPKDKCHGLALQ